MTSSNFSEIPPLPAAFRDTAVTVAALTRPLASGSCAALRQRCREQVQQLRDQMLAGGHPPDVIEDACYAQCALLDEAVLSHLSGTDRDEWEREPLQVAQFGSHHAGDALIERMQQRLREPQPVLLLLAIFHAALGLGFRGRFALAGGDARLAMLNALSERLGVTDAQANGVIVAAPGRHRWWASLSLPVWLLGAVLVAVLVYLLLEQWLDAAVAGLMQ
jgi:type VI secretion system protein ImpK